MDKQEQKAGRRLTRQEISDNVSPLGWRYVLGLIRTCVRVGSLAQAAEVAGRVVAAAAGADDGRAADECLWMDVRRDRLIVTLQSPVTPQVTKREIDVAHRISAAVSELGLAAAADNEGAATRSIQVMEIAIDALDIASIRPFWKAIMGYDDEAGATGPRDPLVDITTWQGRDR